MTQQLTGRIEYIKEPEQINDKVIKQLLVIQTAGNYPQTVAFEIINKPDMLNNYTVGQTVTVFFDIRGRQWQDRYFNTLNAWKVELAN